MFTPLTNEDYTVTCAHDAENVKYLANIRFASALFNNIAGLVVFEPEIVHFLPLLDIGMKQNQTNPSVA